MIRQLKIRTKFIVLGIVGALALTYIVSNSINISKLGVYSLNKVYQDSRQVENIQQQLIAPIFYLRELSLSLVTAPNDDFRKQLHEKLEPLIDSLDQRFYNVNPQLKKQWLRYKNFLRTTQDFVNKGFEEGAFINVNQDERKQFYLLISILQKMQTKELEKSFVTYETAKQKIEEKRSAIIISSVILSLFIIILSWFIINKIANAIEQVKDGHTRFFKFLKDKNTNETIGITLENNDELGEMARVINKEMEEAKTTLKQDMQLIESATKMLDELKEGHLEKRLTVDAKSKELNALKRVINEMVDDLELKIQQEIIKRTGQEKLLIQQSKLASMGNMIGNIAHQWRQPLCELNAVLMNIETRYKFNDFDENFIENSVKECNDITEYMSHTISDFQNFFKPSKTKEYFSIVDSCKKAGAILQSSLKFHNINYHCECGEYKEIFGYPNEFSQAFLNILSNAKDVLIQREIKNPFINVSIKTGKKYILIKVEDNAGGIDNKNLERIFEPYFTTKHAKQGTGIGLYMSKTIIEGNMDGFLNVKNTNKGACFTIKLV